MKVYGKNSVRSALEFQKKIRKAYLLNNFSDEFIESSLEKLKIPITYMEDFKKLKLDDTRHQGIILDIEEFKYEELSSINVDNAKVIILDHLEDVHNFGAIIRTAEAFQIDGVIIPDIRSVDVNETVVHTSSGAIFNMKIIKEGNLVNTINKLKDMGFWIVATDMDGLNYQEIDYSGKIALIIGNEHKGVSQLIKRNSDYIARIPMKGKVNSLNASVAAGIFIEAITNGDKLI